MPCVKANQPRRLPGAYMPRALATLHIFFMSASTALSILSLWQSRQIWVAIKHQPSDWLSRSRQWDLLQCLTYRLLLVPISQ